jgi:tRNA threonylcarbamoyladenosine biosynthesis protein TsaB
VHATPGRTGRSRGSTSGDGTRGWLLAIDTSTTRIVVAAGRPDGSLFRVMGWPAGHRHGEQLLAGVEELLAATGLARASLEGVVVGTGPGAFTGLRVGLATAKTLAHAMGIPIAGVGTGAALLHAVRGATKGPLALLLPAGPHDRVLVRGDGPAQLLPGGVDPDLPRSATLVAVDLDGRAPAAASALGATAAMGIGAALLELGAARLRDGQGDDVERLVPEYVTLPRGVRASRGEISWSHDPR